MGGKWFSIFVLNNSFSFNRDIQGGADGGMTPPIFSDLQESLSNANHAAREFSTAFSVTFFFPFFSNNSWSIGHNAPLRKVSRHTTGDIMG